MAKRSKSASVRSKSKQISASSADTFSFLKDASDDARSVITVLLLLAFPVVGLVSMWFWTRWETWVKGVVTVFLLLPLFFLWMFIAQFFLPFLFVTTWW